jgi:tRNA(Ile)-lysidine synthetase-like protein
MNLVEEFRRHLGRLPLPSGRAIVAVSGGPDSIALLDLLLRTRDFHQLELIVAHADHGISAESGSVAARVRDLASSLGLPCEVGELRLGAIAGETSARTARYLWLAAVREQMGASCIITAHHADDQAETVLMRALKGSGPAGLAGMAAVSGGLLRPLLPFRREDLARYVRDRELPVWLDPANQDPRHLRSWIRCDVLPLLRRRLPEIDPSLLRLARQAAADRVAWDAVLALLPGLDFRREPDAFSVAGPVLAGYDSGLAGAIIMAAARRAACPVGPARAERVWDLARAGISGSEVPLARGWKAEFSFGRVRLVRPGLPPVRTPWTLGGDRGEGKWGRWRIRWRREAAPERQDSSALTAWFSGDGLTVRGWVPGEKMRSLARAGRRRVVRCFQEARVPRSQRPDWPILARQDDVVWIPGVCRSDALLPAPGAEALRVDAEHT